MKLVIAATPKVALPTITQLSKSHEILLVTQPDSASGRGKKIQPTEIGAIFPEAHKPESEAALQELLRGADLLITIGYGRLLPETVINTAKFGGINLHFSLLPKWRGAAPVQRAIEAGDKITGVSVFQMDKGMDTGPIWVQKDFAIQENTSASQLFEALSILGSSAVLETLIAIQNGESPSIQLGEPSIAKKVSKLECIVDWNSDAVSIVRKIKAFSFNPGSTSVIRNESIKLNDAIWSPIQLRVGELSPKGEVGAINGSVQLLNVTPAGKRPMNIKDWLNGFKPVPGDVFG